MLSGLNLWSSYITENMVNIEIGSKQIFTYPSMHKNLYEILINTAKKHPQKIAVIDDNNKEYSFNQILELVDNFASILKFRFGIKKQSHISLMLHNGIEFYVSLLALSKISAVTVALPTKYSKEEILSLIKKSDTNTIICEEKYANYFENENNLKIIESKNYNSSYGFDYLYDNNYEYIEIEPEYNLDDKSIIIFTSGTTSQSKGVMLKNYNIMHAIISYSKILNINENDKSIIATPIYNITGIVGLLGLFLYKGGSLYINKKFDDKRFLKCLIDNEITFIHASPTVFTLLLNNINKFQKIKSVKQLVCGSSNISPENIRRLKNMFPNMSFRTVYGLTESSSPATIFPTDATTSEYIGSSGIAIPGLEIKIIDENNNDIGFDEMGEVTLKGTNILENYHNIKTDLIDSEGWLKTGDLGYINKEGYLYIVDRKKDVINRGGEKICSFDIENKIQAIEGVLDAAVVSKIDEKYGEVPVAVVRLANEANLNEEYIKEILKTKLAKYEIPVQIMFVDEMIKTPNGKIDKKSIRKLFN